MTPMDNIGNVLMIKDLVMFQSSNGDLFLGQVEKIDEPSIIDKPNPAQQQAPGIVVVSFMPVSIPFDSRRPFRITNLTKVVRPLHLTETKSQA